MVFNTKGHKFFEQNYGFKKALLTTSFFAAREISVLLIDVTGAFLFGQLENLDKIQEKKFTKKNMCKVSFFRRFWC